MRCSVGRPCTTSAMTTICVSRPVLLKVPSCGSPMGSTSHGETGAGKTILAHALDLLLGGKARS